MRYFVIRDAVHGDIYLTREEGRLLDTKEMQRLRGIRQLGVAHLVYPSARHSRFEHSIGTLQMTQALIDAVRRNAELHPSSSRSVDDDEARILRAAALLHDVTHIPFGHNIEDQTGLLPRHDEPERFRRVLDPSTELGHELVQQGLRDAVLEVLGAKEGTLAPFLSQMISDTICSDLMDYLARDAWGTGLNLRYDARIADYFQVDVETGRLFVDCEKEGLVREDIVSEVLRMLQARYYFSERVYYHHAKIAAGAMISRVVEQALLSERLEVSELLADTDAGLLLRLRQRFEEDAGKDGEGGRRLLARLTSRRLYKRVAVFPYAQNQGMQQELLGRFFARSAAKSRRDWEREREREVEARFGRKEQVLLYCPNRKMQLKEALTLVRHPDLTGIAPLAELRGRLPRIADLEDSYLRLWKVYVFSSATDRETRAFLQARVRESLPEAVDAYRLKDE